VPAEQFGKGEGSWRIYRERSEGPVNAEYALSLIERANMFPGE